MDAQKNIRQKNYRRITEELQKNYRRITEELQKNYRRIHGWARVEVKRLRPIAIAAGILGALCN